MEYDIETVVFDDALYHPVELTIPLPDTDLGIQAKLSVVILFNDENNVPSAHCLYVPLEVTPLAISFLFIPEFDLPYS